MPDRASQKIYVHVDGKTTVLRGIALDATVDDICASWAALSGDNQLAGVVRASTTKGRELQGCQVISRALGPHPEICLAVTSQQVDVDHSHQTTERLRAPSNREEFPAATDDSSASEVEHSPEATESRASPSPLIAPLLERAAEKEASQHYKSAAFIYEQARESSQSSLMSGMYLMLAHGISISKTSILSFPMPMQILAIDSRHQETLLRYVRLLQRAKQPAQALACSLRAVKAHPNVFEIALLHADCLRYTFHFQHPWAALPVHLKALLRRGYSAQ